MDMAHSKTSLCPKSKESFWRWSGRKPWLFPFSHVSESKVKCETLLYAWCLNVEFCQVFTTSKLVKICQNQHKMTCINKRCPKSTRQVSKGHLFGTRLAKRCFINIPYWLTRHSWFLNKSRQKRRRQKGRKWKIRISAVGLEHILKNHHIYRLHFRK